MIESCSFVVSSLPRGLALWVLHRGLSEDKVIRGRVATRKKHINLIQR